MALPAVEVQVYCRTLLMRSLWRSAREDGGEPPCTSGASHAPQQSRQAGSRRRRGELGFLAALGALLGGNGQAEAYQMDSVQITRPTTCPEGLERVLGWPTNVCR